jgi:phospholipase/carboxylesterase
MAEVLDCVEHCTGAAPAWSVLWLHGLGADGHDFAPIVPALLRPEWPALRFVFPHAPVRPVTLNGGVRMRAWYDLTSLDFDQRADEAGLSESVQAVAALAAREQARGIAASRIVLAGFSQGGAVALAAATDPALAPFAGVVGLSAYLPRAVATLAPAKAAQPVFLGHGLHDPVVPRLAGQSAAERLRAAGLAVAWHDYPMAHQVCDAEIADLAAWLGAILRA